MSDYEPEAVWRPYGLRGDPFFTAPLSMATGVTHGIHLFQGDARRELAEQIVQRVLNSDHSVRLVEGPNGIGKTTLASLAKHILADVGGTAVYPEIVDVHLDHERPIEALAAAILLASINALRAADPDAASEAEDAGRGLVIDDLVGLRTSEASLRYVLGFKRSRSEVLKEARERAFADWREALQNVSAAARAGGIDRIVIHINNLDQAVLKDFKKTGDLFGTARDLFQIQGFHFILCASEGFRLRSLKDRQNFLDILGTPIRPEALGKDDVVQLMQARYDDLAIQDAALTPPMLPKHFAELYTAFGGELRAALEAAGQVFKEERGPTGTAEQLDAQEILDYQRPLVEDILGNLTDIQLDVLRAVHRLAGTQDVRQADVVKDLGERQGMKQGTISGAAEVLAAQHWVTIRRRTMRETYYRLGGRARIVQDILAYTLRR